jgi:hypothetical protein
MNARSMPDRNPYLILGVDFGASADDARHAFAHAARRIRRQGGAWEIEDLNWALHEIETLEANPGDTVSLYRIPANPAVFEPAGEGLFKPPPARLRRRTQAGDPSALAELRAAAAAELEELVLTAYAAVADASTLAYPLAAG